MRVQERRIATLEHGVHEQRDEPSARSRAR